MWNQNKVQLRTTEMPRSFYITKEEYSQIYPEAMTPRRVPITFNFSTKSVWVEKEIAEYIINKYPNICYLYDNEMPKGVNDGEVQKEKEEKMSVSDTDPSSDVNLQQQKVERFAELKKKGWFNLDKEERDEYKELKKEL